MALCMSQYDVDFFNSTPLLSSALESHQKLGGNAWIHEMFGPLFREYKVENILGVALIHHHFPLKKGEYLTDVNGASTPWTSTTGIQPSCWAIDTATDNILRPFEFSVENERSSVTYPDWSDPKIQTFLKNFVALLISYGASKVYGLTRYPGDNFPGRVEMTVGRCNINLTPLQADKIEPATQSEAAWFFTDNFTKRGCSCNCFHHGTENTSHTHIPTVKT